MRATPRRTFVISALFCAGVVLTSCSKSSPSAPTPSPQPPVAVVPPVEPEPVPQPPVNQTPVTPVQPIPPTSGGTWINVFGDTGWCGSTAMPQIARLLNDLGGDILLAGDLAYEAGRLDEFKRCFEPDFGRFVSKTWAVPGNHEYVTGTANDFFTFFGDRAGPARRGYYNLRMAGWNVLMLDSNASMARSSAQVDFVRTTLTQNPARCTLAVMHHPFDSSGPNGPSPSQRDLWSALYDSGADVVVAGHDHLYERHAPQDPSQRQDPVNGIRLFVAGTGGARPYPRARQAINSQLVLSMHGVLRLKLEPALYEWEFRDVNGVVQDKGLNICH